MHMICTICGIDDVPDEMVRADDGQVYCTECYNQKLIQLLDIPDWEAEEISEDILSAKVVCRICGHRHTAMYTEDEDEESLECPECGNNTCEPLDEEEW